MEQKVNVWKANITNGLIMGMAAVIYSLVIYFTDLIFNKAQGYIFMIIQIALLAYLVKSYRDNSLFGRITYGQAVGAGVIICLYCAIVATAFQYLLYSVIDTGLIAKQIAFAEETMQAKGLPQETIDAAMKVQQKLITPGFIAIMGIFGNMFWGTIMSLAVAMFVKKAGNPLADTPTDL
ncbi:MAG: DUF4199 domain-containing protein [Bacteroidales bacterium]|jgi:hypothetical protein|nr:DUF4199 domain-containing protein [Bacteroidales bacterium]